MKALVSRIRYYLSVYAHILRLTGQMLLEYRVDAIIRTSYAAVFLIGVFFAIQIAFTHTPTLGGFTKDEILLFYATSITIWATMEALFFDGFKVFMLRDIVTGEFDKILTKPVNPVFLMAFSRPRLEGFVYLFGMMLLGFRQMLILSDQFTMMSFVSYFALWLTGLYIFFMAFSIYATLAFYMTRSSQVLRTLQSISDQTFYPPTIYPTSLKMILFTLIPAAFVAYVPVSFLLNRGSIDLLLATVSMIITVTWLSNTCWRVGLKNYTSASS